MNANTNVLLKKGSYEHQLYFVKTGSYKDYYCSVGE